MKNAIQAAARGSIDVSFVIGTGVSIRVELFRILERFAAS